MNPSKTYRQFLRRSLPVALFCLVCLLAILPANSREYYFRKYQVEHGLSNNATICMLQDRRGFMWFGTKDGLNRFDGYNFKVFRTEAGDSASLGNNFIHCLYQDVQGTMWIGTESGLYSYNPSLENFTLLAGTAHQPIRDVVVDGKGNLWFIAGFELKQRTPKGPIVNHAARFGFETTALCTTGDGNVWAATPAGYLKKYQPTTNSFATIDMLPKAPKGSVRWIEKIYATEAGQIMVGFSNLGAKVYHPAEGSIQSILQLNPDGTEVFVRNFLQVKPDEWWIGTESGIFIYNSSTGISHNLQKSYNTPYALSDNAVYSFCKDREGGIWAGTYFGGINYLPMAQTPFRKFFPMIGQNSISGNVVREIQADGDGNLWIGTEDAGLNHYNTTTGLFTSYRPSGAGNISYTNIHGLLVDGNQVWIGTFEHGLDVMDRRTGRVVRHYSSGSGPNQLKSNFIFSIIKTRQYGILLATTRGAFSYNPQHDHFTPIPHLPPNTWYSSLLVQKDGSIWAATYGNGVFYYNATTGRSGNYRRQSGNPHSLPSNRVNSIYQDRHQRLWFATEAGLCRLNASTGQFELFTTKQGLPSNFILSQLEDQQGNLWISTSKGLAMMAANNGNITSYTTANGLLSDQFNFNSAYRDPQGRLYFGSVKGMVSFNPAHFTPNQYVPPVYITGFRIFNSEPVIGADDSPLQQAISVTQKIVLPYNQSTISIDFAALSYTAPEMLEYAYRLDGQEKDWTRLHRNRTAYFTGLATGNYTFRVKAANSSGRWQGKEATLQLVILPPWWLSRWAYLAYALLLVLGVYAAVSWYHKRQTARNRRRFEKLKTAKEKEVYEAKVEFFTRVAHEIKTPLALIKAPLEKVIKKNENHAGTDYYLKIMERNTNRLIDLTSQLLDFSQTEIKGYSLSFTQVEVTQLVNDAYQSFTPVAEQRNLTFKLSLPGTPLLAWIDVDAFNKILFNLLTNALKYSEHLVAVSLQALAEGQHFTLTVTNDGYIIPPEMAHRIFEPFVRLKQTEKTSGSGIGLALAMSLVQLHNGSLVLDTSNPQHNHFVLTLPKTQAAGNSAQYQPAPVTTT